MIFRSIVIYFELKLALIIPTPANDVMTGTDASDEMAGAWGDDTLYGGAGRDVFLDGVYRWQDDPLMLPDEDEPYFETGGVYDVGLGSDTYVGGLGRDRLYYMNRSEAVTVRASTGTVITAVGTDHFSEIERIYLTNEDDVLFQAAGETAYFLGYGDDRVVVGRNGLSDRTVGGRGRDQLDMRAVTADVYYSAAGGVDLFNGDFGSHFRVSGFEIVRGSRSNHNSLRGAGADEVLIGGGQHDTIYGNAGDDRLVGRAGSDLISGGDGNDVIRAGVDDDTVFGNEGSDRIYGGAGADEIGVDADDLGYGGAGDDIVTVVGGIAYGGSGSDTLTGSHDATVYGGAGNDHFIVGNEDGVFTGNYFGGAGDDDLTITIDNQVSFYELELMFDGGDGFDRIILSGTNGMMFDGAVISNVEEVEIQYPGSEYELIGIECDILFDSVSASIVEVSGGVGTMAFGGDSDGVMLYVSGGDWTVDFNAGDHYVQLLAAQDGQTVVNGNRGADTVVFYRNGDFYGNGGDDSVIINTSLNSSTISLGNGDDQLTCHDHFDFLDLGAGADYAWINAFSGSGEIDCGNANDGRDLISYGFDVSGRLTLTDFDVAQDQLSSDAMFDLSRDDFDVSQGAIGAELLFVGALEDGEVANFTIVLAGVDVASVNDAIFF